MSISLLLALRLNENCARDYLWQSYVSDGCVLWPKCIHGHHHPHHIHCVRSGNGAWLGKVSVFGLTCKMHIPLTDFSFSLIKRFVYSSLGGIAVKTQWNISWPFIIGPFVQCALGLRVKIYWSPSVREPIAFEISQINLSHFQLPRSFRRTTNVSQEVSCGVFH